MMETEKGELDLNLPAILVEMTHHGIKFGEAHLNFPKMFKEKERKQQPLWVGSLLVCSNLVQLV